MLLLNKFTVNSVQCFVIVLLCSTIEYTKMYNEDITEIVSRLTSLKLSLDNLTDKCNYITSESVDFISNNKSDLNFIFHYTLGWL